MDIASSLSLLLYLPGSDKREKGTNGLSSEQKGLGADFGFFKGVFFKHSPKKRNAKNGPKEPCLTDFAINGTMGTIIFVLCSPFLCLRM